MSLNQHNGKVLQINQDKGKVLKIRLIAILIYHSIIFSAKSLSSEQQVNLSSYNLTSQLSTSKSFKVQVLNSSHRSIQLINQSNHYKQYLLSAQQVQKTQLQREFSLQEQMVFLNTSKEIKIVGDLIFVKTSINAKDLKLGLSEQNIKVSSNRLLYDEKPIQLVYSPLSYEKFNTSNVTNYNTTNTNTTNSTNSTSTIGTMDSTVNGTNTTNNTITTNTTNTTIASNTTTANETKTNTTNATNTNIINTNTTNATGTNSTNLNTTTINSTVHSTVNSRQTLTSNNTQSLNSSKLTNTTINSTVINDTKKIVENTSIPLDTAVNDTTGKINQTITSNVTQNITNITQNITNVTQNASSLNQTIHVLTFYHLKSNTSFLILSQKTVKDLFSYRNHLTVLYEDGTVIYYRLSDSATNNLTQLLTLSQLYTLKIQNQLKTLIFQVNQIGQNTTSSITNSLTVTYNNTNSLVINSMLPSKVILNSSSATALGLSNIKLSNTISQQNELLTILTIRTNLTTNISETRIRLLNLSSISMSIDSSTSKIQDSSFLTVNLTNLISKNSQIQQQNNFLIKNNPNQTIKLKILNQQKGTVAIVNTNQINQNTTQPKIFEFIMLNNIVDSQKSTVNQNNDINTTTRLLQQNYPSFDYYSLNLSNINITNSQDTSVDISLTSIINYSISNYALNPNGNKVLLYLTSSSSSFLMECLVQNPSCTIKSSINTNYRTALLLLEYYSFNSYFLMDSSFVLSFQQNQSDFYSQSQKQIEQTIFLQHLQQLLNTTTIQTISSMASIPNLKQLIIILSPIYVFIDDFWFYSYHHQRNYSYNLKLAFSIIRYINQARLYPQFISPLIQNVKQQLSIGDRLSSKTYSHYLKASDPQFLANEEKASYFLANIQELVVWNFPIVLIIYLIFKFLSLTPLSRFSFLQFYLKLNSSSTIILSGFIQANVQLFTFMAFKQLSYPFLFAFNDKTNMLICLTVLFVVMFFCISGYILVWSLLSKTSGYVFIDGMKNTKNSYLNVTVITCLRCFLAGFVHSYFYNQKPIQNILILGIDIIALATITKFRQCFDSIITVYLYQMYYGAKLILDVIILYEFHSTDKTGTTEKLQFYMMLILVGATILRALWHFLLSIHQKLFPFANQTQKQQLKAQCNNSNRVHNLNDQKVRKKETQKNTKSKNSQREDIKRKKEKLKKVKVLENDKITLYHRTMKTIKFQQQGQQSLQVISCKQQSEQQSNNRSSQQQVQNHRQNEILRQPIKPLIRFRYHKTQKTIKFNSKIRLEPNDSTNSSNGQTKKSSDNLIVKKKKNLTQITFFNKQKMQEKQNATPKNKGQSNDQDLSQECEIRKIGIYQNGKRQAKPKHLDHKSHSTEIQKPQQLGFFKNNKIAPLKVNSSIQNTNYQRDIMTKNTDNSYSLNQKPVIFKSKGAQSQFEQPFPVSNLRPHMTKTTKLKTLKRIIYNSDTFRKIPQIANQLKTININEQ